MSEREAFVDATIPRYVEADTALHNGDVGLRTAMWSRNDPVTLWRCGLGTIPSLCSARGSRPPVGRTSTASSRGSEMRWRTVSRSKSSSLLPTQARISRTRSPTSTRRRPSIARTAHLHAPRNAGLPTRGGQVEGSSPPCRPAAGGVRRRLNPNRNYRWSVVEPGLKTQNPPLDGSNAWFPTRD